MGSFSLKRQSKCKASYFCYFVKKGPGKCRNYRWICNSIRTVPLDRYTVAGESLGGQYRARQTNNKAFFREFLRNIWITIYISSFFVLLGFFCPVLSFRSCNLMFIAQVVSNQLKKKTQYVFERKFEKKNGILLIRGNSHLSSFVVLSNNKRRAILDVNIRRRGKLGKIFHRSIYSCI
jgi:hypothetical protein